jgi:hypothetical protein
MDLPVTVVCEQHGTYLGLKGGNLLPCIECQPLPCRDCVEGRTEGECPECGPGVSIEDVRRMIFTNEMMKEMDSGE